MDPNQSAGTVGIGQDVSQNVSGAVGVTQNSAQPMTEQPLNPDDVVDLNKPSMQENSKSHHSKEGMDIGTGSKDGRDEMGSKNSKDGSKKSGGVNANPDQ